MTMRERERVTNHLGKVIDKHGAQYSCQGKNPAKQESEKRTNNYLKSSKKIKDHLVTLTLPVIIYAWLPNAFKSFRIKVEDRSLYSINFQFYRGSPYPNPCKKCNARPVSNSVNEWLLRSGTLWSYLHLPFVFVSRMCPTPNPARTWDFKPQEIR